LHHQPLCLFGELPICEPSTTATAPAMLPSVSGIGTVLTSTGIRVPSSGTSLLHLFQLFPAQRARYGQVLIGHRLPVLLDSSGRDLQPRQIA
jgi:hypothetical protein